MEERGGVRWACEWSCTGSRGICLNKWRAARLGAVGGRGKVGCCRWHGNVGHHLQKGVARWTKRRQEVGQMIGGRMAGAVAARIDKLYSIQNSPWWLLIIGVQQWWKDSQMHWTWGQGKRSLRSSLWVREIQKIMANKLAQDPGRLICPKRWDS